MADPPREDEAAPHFVHKPCHSAWGSSGSSSTQTPPPPYTLLDASWRYAGDIQEGRRFLALFWRSQIVCGDPDDFTLENHQDLSDLRDILEANLVAKLLAGELVGFWLPPGMTSPAPIHAEWWRRARIDLRLNQAQLDQTVINNITIYPHETPRPHPSGVAGRPTSRPLLEAKMRARADRGELLPTLAAEVRYLREWLKNTHPEEPRAKQDAAETSVRGFYKVM